VLAVTRNRDGAEVLNTNRILIADIDLPELREPTTGGLLRRLFRRSQTGSAPSSARIWPPLADDVGSSTPVTNTRSPAATAR
jgi:hypothetical protein